MRLGVVLFIVLNVDKELLGPELLKEAQQGRLESLYVSSWDLVDLRARNLLVEEELEASQEAFMIANTRFSAAAFQRTASDIPEGAALQGMAYVLLRGF